MKVTQNVHVINETECSGACVWVLKDVVVSAQSGGHS